ncbi:MAG: isoprenylcysteine carboxylmethyltransferase family protein [Actinobacteria bacterium]|nr:isoprenylcysteine carboxylmethyltransferase family protein [Actinomycetota bacterium]
MNQRALGWTLVGVQFAMLIVLILLPWRSPSLLSLAIGVPIAAAGAVLGLFAGRRLGRALTPTPVPLSGAGLRTDGAYRYVRHPIYSAVLLMVLGYVIAIGSLASVAWTVAILVFFMVKSRWEDRLLHAEYRAQWQDWARGTGRLVPRIGRVDDGQ